MRRLLSTAKTTLLPANHSLDTKKGLHSTARLDDTLGHSLPITYPSLTSALAGLAALSWASQMCQTETLVILKAVGLGCPEVTAMQFGTPQSFGWRSASL
jgi:hypothetical protein